MVPPSVRRPPTGRVIPSTNGHLALGHISVWNVRVSRTVTQEAERAFGRSCRELALSTCVTCGTELHPERAEKYDYCTRPECVRQNARGLDMVGVGVNKAAEQYVILDDRTKEEMASGRFKKRPEAGGSQPVVPAAPEKQQVQKPAPAFKRRPQRPQWSETQENLALIYRRMGMTPGQIAAKLGVSESLATRILLEATARGRR